MESHTERRRRLARIRSQRSRQVEDESQREQRREADRRRRRVIRQQESDVRRSQRVVRIVAQISLGEVSIHSGTHLFDRRRNLEDQFLCSAPTHFKTSIYGPHALALVSFPACHALPARKSDRLAGNDTSLYPRFPRGTSCVPQRMH